MSNYGVQPTGYVRKPLAVILGEIEALMVTEFGPGVIQTPQSPLGQLNGLFADLVADIEQRNLDLYQSYDPDQAEGTRLDTLARIRLVDRGAKTDEEMRQAITNDNVTRVDVQDAVLAVQAVDGVTYARVYVNETGSLDERGLEGGTVALAVIGGTDEDVALAFRPYIAPGINTFGNTRIETLVDGRCRSISVIRPVDIAMTVEVLVRLTSDVAGCPPPSPAAIRDLLVEQWAEQRDNGTDVTAFTVRSIIEFAFNNVEVVNVTASRDDGQPVIIGFQEIASLATADVTVTVA